jgi:hypothetical protein
VQSNYITYLRNLFLKKINVFITFQRDIYNPSTVYQPGTYMSLAQSKNKRRLNFFKNLHVYYEKDNLCFLLKLLNNIKILKTVVIFNLSKTIIIR